MRPFTSGNKTHKRKVGQNGTLKTCIACHSFWFVGMTEFLARKSKRHLRLNSYRSIGMQEFLAIRNPGRLSQKLVKILGTGRQRECLESKVQEISVGEGKTKTQVESLDSHIFVFLLHSISEYLC